MHLYGSFDLLYDDLQVSQQLILVLVLLPEIVLCPSLLYASYLVISTASWEMSEFIEETLPMARLTTFRRPVPLSAAILTHRRASSSQ